MEEWFGLIRFSLNGIFIEKSKYKIIKKKNQCTMKSY